ncbi:MAG: shikimate dehydrogenase [Nitrososphaerota archaeon]
MAFLAVIGHPVGHSLSPLMHNSTLWMYRLPHRYLAIDILPENLRNVINSLWKLEFIGFNITIPHKEQVAKIAIELSEEAASTGAVNTTIRKSDGWAGFNTDVEGFISSFSRLNVRMIDTCLILGAGGSAKAATYALDKMGARKIIIANRTPERAIKLRELMDPKISSNLEIISLDDVNNHVSRVDVVINATPVGLMDDKLLINPECLTIDQIVYDLVYSPRPTPLIRAAMNRGCKIIDGVVHLVEQGAASFRIWTGITPETSFMEKVVRTELLRRWRRSEIS